MNTATMLLTFSPKFLMNKFASLVGITMFVFAGVIVGRQFGFDSNLKGDLGSCASSCDAMPDPAMCRAACSSATPGNTVTPPTPLPGMEMPASNGSTTAPLPGMPIPGTEMIGTAPTPGMMPMPGTDANTPPANVNGGMPTPVIPPANLNIGNNNVPRTALECSNKTNPKGIGTFPVRGVSGQFTNLDGYGNPLSNHAIAALEELGRVTAVAMADAACKSAEVATCTGGCRDAKIYIDGELVPAVTYDYTFAAVVRNSRNSYPAHYEATGTCRVTRLCDAVNP